MKISLFLFIFTVAATFFVSISDNQKSAVAAENRIGSVTRAIYPQPKIISRKDWNAKEPVGTAKEHSIRSITIHHTATLQKTDVSIEKKMQNLQSFSQSESRLASGKLKPVWFDIPYHYYIAVDGKIAEGREIKYVGDTNTNYDPTGHALIVLEGNFETEEPTKEQQKALEEMVAWLVSKYNIPTAEIKGHSDFAATACPGKNLKKIFPDLQKKVGEMVMGKN